MQRNPCTLITGASSGIGRAIAVDLSEDRSLILHGRDEGRLEETRQLCTNRGHHLIWSFDLENLTELETALPALLHQHALAIDAFVHSAGFLTVLPMRNITVAMAQHMMAVNFFSAGEIIRLLLRRRINDRQLRRIVFVSSTASKFGAKGFNYYSATKGALDALMRALAVELAPGIHVNSVLAGGVRTAMTEKIFEDAELAARLEADYPLGIGEPADVATAVRFLLSAEASWITGEQLVVDGGRTINITA